VNRRGQRPCQSEFGHCISGTSKTNTREIEKIVIKASLQGKPLVTRNLKQQHNKAQEPAVKVRLKLELDFAEKEKRLRMMRSKAMSNLCATDLAKAQGKTRESLVNEIELILKTFGASKEAYHGGDYNVVAISFIIHFEETGETELIFIPRGASCIQIRDFKLIVHGDKMANVKKKVGLVYSRVDGGQGPLSFSTFNKVATEKMKTAAKTKIVLIIPSFTLFITGDLSLYADSRGKHKSCSYWSIYCLLNRLQWQSDGHEKGDLWTK
jgi:hypothetical protein